MTRKLPPLNALKAFVASANQLSFTKAASDLGVTQGAVSKQIKLLEDYLGLELFTRKGQNLIITRTGKSYLNEVAKSLEIIEQATLKLLNENEEVLHINIPSSFYNWLIPHLGDFKKRFSCNINIQTGNGAIDFEQTGADLAVRVSQKNVWKGFRVERFMEEDLIPVCSPALKSAHPINNVKDLVKHDLILHTSRPKMWEDYLSAIGYKDFKPKYKLRAEQFFMLIEAARNGLGIILVQRMLIEKELQKNTLVIALKTDFKSDWGHYFICPKPKADLKKVKNFREWLSELGKEISKSAQ